MAMNDEETAALIVGGHTFGKTHGAVARRRTSARSRGRALEQQGLGWKNSFGSGKGADTITSGLEGAWTNDADQVGQRLPGQPVRLRMGADQEPGRRVSSGSPKNAEAQGTVPDAHDPSKRHAPTMLTTDLALRSTRSTSRSPGASCEHPDEFADAFAKAWYKLLHRDMGPLSRYLGPWVPEPQLWQDPVPAGRPRPDRRRTTSPRSSSKLLDSGLSVAQLVATAWASAASFRGTDKRGGANGARIRLEPQQDWEVNEPAELAKVLQALERVQQDFNARSPAARRSRSPT